MVGPQTAIVRMDSSISFPQGETNRVRSVLMYDGPSKKQGTCLFQIGHRERGSFTIVKEPQVAAPCNGKTWARFRIAGSEIDFVAHLLHTKYKSTPVTLLEISTQQIPSSLHLVY